MFIAGVVFYYSFEHERSYFYENAEFVDADFLKKLDKEINMLNEYRLLKRVLRKNPSRKVHNYKKGTGIIYSYKWTSANDFNVSDEETFKTISIWLAAIPKQGHTSVPLKGNNLVKGVITKGSRVWVARNCSWIMQDGEIVINSKGNNTTISLDVTLKTIASLSYHCKDKRLKQIFSMKKKTLK